MVRELREPSSERASVRRKAGNESSTRSVRMGLTMAAVKFLTSKNVFKSTLTPDPEFGMARDPPTARRLILPRLPDVRLRATRTAEMGRFSMR